MSYEYMKRLEEQLAIPEELKRRKERLEKIKLAKEVVEARAAERYKVEKKEYDQKMARRQEQEEKTGKKPKGKTPKEPDSTPLESDQYNFTDPEFGAWRIRDHNSSGSRHRLFQWK